MQYNNFFLLSFITFTIILKPFLFLLQKFFDIFHGPSFNFCLSLFQKDFDIFYVLILIFFTCFISKSSSIHFFIRTIILCTPPLSAGVVVGGGGVQPPTKFSKRGGGLGKTSTFRGGDFFSGGLQFSHKK